MEVCYSACDNIQVILAFMQNDFLFYFIISMHFSRVKEESGWWLLGVKREKRLKKINKYWYFNKMAYKIDN